MEKYLPYYMNSISQLSLANPQRLLSMHRNSILVRHGIRMVHCATANRTSYAFQSILLDISILAIITYLHNDLTLELSISDFPNLINKIGTGTRANAISPSTKFL